MESNIRLATEADAERILAIYSPFVTDTVISFETVEPSIADIRQRIRETTQFFPWLVYTQSEKVVGYAYATKHSARAAYQWSVDVSVYVNSVFHGIGIGKALYVSLIKILEDQGFYNAYGIITLPNAASVGLHEKMGFVRIGVFREVGFKHRAWRDVGWWQLDLKPKDLDPKEPISIHKLLSVNKEDAARKYGIVL